MLKKILESLDRTFIIANLLEIKKLRVSPVKEVCFLLMLKYSREIKIEKQVEI